MKSHPSGQLADQLDGAPSRDDTPVFRFQVFNGTGNDITIDQVVFPLSGIAGVAGTDLTDLKLHDESGYVGGVGAASITGATGAITFTGDFTVTAGQTKNYTLYADLANLVKNDTLTVSVAPGNVTVLAGDVGGVSPASATHLVDHTLVLGAHASGQVTDQFDGGLSQTGIDLFRFQLDSDSLSDTTVNQLAVQLSAVTGIAAGDLANLRLYNGTADVGGTPAVSIAAGTGTVTFSTPFAVTANTVVNYRLIGDVVNLASGDTLTLSLGTANVTLAAGTVGGSAPSNATHTADPTVLLGSHGSGQVADQFDGSLSQTGKTLFRFRLTNNSTSTKTVNQLAFPLSAVTGIGAGDLSALRVWNGTADVGGAASVSIAAGSGTITFSAPFNLAPSAVVDYELIGDAASLVSGDTVTIGLGTANVTLAAGTTGGTPPASVSHTAEHTVLLGSHASGQVADQWNTYATEAGKTLFRFRLVNNSGATVTVDQVQLQLASVVGVASGDLSSLKLNDGTSDVSTGGTASIAGATGTITLAANFTIAAGATKDYALIGDAANLQPLDAITVSLGTANVALLAGSVGGTTPASIMHRTDPPSIDSEITDTNDDAWEDSGSSPDSVTRTANEISISNNTNLLNRNHGGFRFQGINVPQGSVVNSAFLKVYMTSTLTDTLIATVYGHDSSASTDFAALPDVDGLDGATTRALTTASTAINQPNYGMGWKLVDVTSIVQELVSEGGWAPGSPMTFLMVGGAVASSPSFASIEDFSAPGTNHARLSIDFNNAALLGTHRCGPGGRPVRGHHRGLRPVALPVPAPKRQGHDDQRRVRDLPAHRRGGDHERRHGQLASQQRDRRPRQLHRFAHRRDRHHHLHAGDRDRHGRGSAPDPPRRRVQPLDRRHDDDLAGHHRRGGSRGPGGAPAAAAHGGDAQLGRAHAAARVQRLRGVGHPAPEVQQARQHHLGPGGGCGGGTVRLAGRQHRPLAAPVEEGAAGAGARQAGCLLPGGRRRQERAVDLDLERHGLGRRVRRRDGGRPGAELHRRRSRPASGPEASTGTRPTSR